MARLSYDTISCQVWLDSVPERPGPVQEICDLHASRLTVPRGWSLRDRRIEVEQLREERLFEDPVPDAPVVAVEPRVAATQPLQVPPVSPPPVSDAGPATAQPEPAEPAEPPTATDPAEPTGEDLPEPDVAEPAAEPVAAEDDPPHDRRDDDADGDLPEALQATSPLLARAFRSTGPQRSVLTQTVGERPT